MAETQTVVYTEQQITEAIDEVSNDRLGTVSAIKSKDALAAYNSLA